MQNYQYLVLSPVKEDLVPTSNEDPSGKFEPIMTREVLTKDNMQFSLNTQKDGGVSIQEKRAQIQNILVSLKAFNVC